MTNTPLVFRDMLRRAVLTLLVAPDPDARFLRRRSSWPVPVVQSMHDAYGALPERLRLISPTPQDITAAEVVSDWLAWLRREHGQDALNLVIVWALGTPTWKLAQRFRIQPRAVRYRMDRAIFLLYAHSVSDLAPPENARCEVGASPDRDLGHATFENTGRGAFELETPAPGKVWITDAQGGHWRKNGQRWRDGT